MEGDEFVALHIHVVQVCAVPGQGMGHVGINGGGAARLFVGVLQLAPVFFFVVGDAENDLFPVAFLDQRGPQAHRQGLPVHEHAIIVDEGTVLVNFRQHVFFGEDPQMPLQILRGDGLGGIAQNVRKEIPLL